MTIQRQYSLPNCTLILDGLSTDPTLNAGMGRPPVSVVTNVQCYLPGREKPLTGGREFLDSLVAAVSDYAQEFLSRIAHPMAHRAQHNLHQLVHLERLSPESHRLTVQPQSSNGSQPAEAATPIQVDLTTVQLFDLVEAIDQMLADAQTLPDLSLKLAPLPRRYVKAQEPLAKRAVPAVIGVSGLAAAAIALFFVPIPEIRQPQPTSNQTEQESSTVTPTPLTTPPGSSPGSSPDSVTTGTTAVDSATTASPSPTESPTAASPSPDPADSSTSADASAGESPNAEAILNNAPEIADPAELEQLQIALYDRLDQSWRTTPTFTEDLVYRVGVSQTGEVVGFKFSNDPALNYVNETPLLDLRFTPPEASNPQPIAQFRVVFKPDGVLEVSPWHGQSTDGAVPAEPSPAPSP